MEKQMKKHGDWNCPSCGDLVFASRYRCRKCGTDKPQEYKDKGDWKCPACSDTVFARRNGVCRCGFKRQDKSEKKSKPEQRPGDWWCSICDSLVFSWKRECRCGQVKPKDNASLSQSKLECVVCLEADAVMASKNCGHKHMCLNCAKQMDKCPTCRKPYSPAQDIIRIFEG